MKATDFVRGKKYITSFNDVLEFHSIDIGSCWFIDNGMDHWAVATNGFIGFPVGMNFDWKEYNEPNETTLDHLPDRITRDQLIVHKYAVGDKMAKAQGLTIDHFELGIQAVKWSQNPNEKSKFLHCHGFNKLSGQFTFFVCKLKTKNELKKLDLL